MRRSLQTRGLKRSFTQGDVTIEVLRGVDLDVQPGEIVALLGPSGSGKSTLLQAVGLLEGGFEGSIRIAGQEAAELDDDGRTALRRDALGFVYQFHHLLPDFDALENVMLPQLIHGADAGAARARAEELLGTLGLAQRLDHRPSKLSGGEQQRVAVARALANRPPLVLADEPTGNLDEAHRRHGVRRIPRRWSAAKAARPWSPPTTNASPPRWTASCGCTRAGWDDRARDPGVSAPMHRINLALLGGVGAARPRLLACSTNRSADQDKLGDRERRASAHSAHPEKRCARQRPTTSSSATCSARRRRSRQRPGRLRQARRASSVLRMENAVLEARTGHRVAVSCSGALALDLPPGVAVVGGRRTLTADVDYTVQPAADGSGDVSCCATPTRSSPRWQRSRGSPSAAPCRPPPTLSRRRRMPWPAGDRRRRRRARSGPSYDCAKAPDVGRDGGVRRQRAGLARSSIWRRNTGALVGGDAGPAPVAAVTRDRFLAYRDRCPSRCMADAYIGRMREIRDIMEGAGGRDKLVDKLCVARFQGRHAP